MQLVTRNVNFKFFACVQHNCIQLITSLSITTLSTNTSCYYIVPYTPQTKTNVEYTAQNTSGIDRVFVQLHASHQQWACL